MTIDLKDDLRIQTDERCWTVRVREIVQSGKTKGKEKWIIEGYYTGLDSALRAALGVRIRRSPGRHEDLESALREIRRLWQEIQSAVPEAARATARS